MDGPRSLMAVGVVVIFPNSNSNSDRYLFFICICICFCTIFLYHPSRKTINVRNLGKRREISAERHMNLYCENEKDEKGMKKKKKKKKQKL